MENIAKKHFGQVADEHIRVGTVIYIEPVLAGFGVALDPLLVKAGLSREQMADPENTVPLVALGKLLAACAETSGCPHFGLLLGNHPIGQSLGLVGDLLPHCANVETALTYLQDFFHLHDRGGFPAMSVAGDVALLSYNILVSDLPGFRQVQDTAMAIALNMMRTLCGQDWKPGLLRLTLGKPIDLQPYRALFGCKVELNAESPEIVFPRRDLGRAIAGGTICASSFSRKNWTVCGARRTSILWPGCGASSWPFWSCSAARWKMWRNIFTCIGAHSIVDLLWRA